MEVLNLVPNMQSLINTVGHKIYIRAGMGLRECNHTVNSLDLASGYKYYTIEGGHVKFSPRNEVQIKLLKFLHIHFASKHRVSRERAISGQGLDNVINFAVQKIPQLINVEVHTTIKAKGNLKDKVISAYAEKEVKVKGDTIFLCQGIMSIFIGLWIRGQVGGNQVSFDLQFCTAQQHCS